jgi:hypothetical protein
VDSSLQNPYFFFSAFTHLHPPVLRISEQGHAGSSLSLHRVDPRDTKLG